MVKLIALDMDGTLLSPDGTLSGGNLAAIKLAAEVGIEIVPASGRALSALPSEVLALEFINYAITSNGANVMDVKSKTQIYSSCISEKAARGLLGLTMDSELVCEAYWAGGAYVSKQRYETISADEIIPAHYIEYFKKTRIPVGDFDDFILGRITEIENFNVITSNLEKRREIYGKASENPLITVTSSFPFNIEMGAPGTNKGEALAELCSKLGISREEVLACGDGDNDKELLEFAGMGVAMAHATKVAMDAANYITKGNDEDGVAYAIMAYAISTPS